MGRIIGLRNASCVPLSRNVVCHRESSATTHGVICTRVGARGRGATGFNAADPCDRRRGSSCFHSHGRTLRHMLQHMIHFACNRTSFSCAPRGGKLSRLFSADPRCTRRNRIWFCDERLPSPFPLARVDRPIRLDVDQCRLKFSQANMPTRDIDRPCHFKAVSL